MDLQKRSKAGERGREEQQRRSEGERGDKQTAGLQQIAVQNKPETGGQVDRGALLTLVMAALEGSLRLGFFFLTSSSSSYRYCERAGTGLLVIFSESVGQKL